MSMLKEFREFAMKGNVVELAVGVMIASAFGSIVNSLISDIITPLLLKPALEAAHLSNIHELTAFGSVKYGAFLAAVINFLIVAFILFLVIKGVNKYKKTLKAAQEAAASPVSNKEEVLLTEIRDILKKQNPR